MPTLTYAPEDPVDNIVYIIKKNFRPKNFFNITPQIKPAHDPKGKGRRIKTTSQNKVEPYLIRESPDESDDATYDFYNADCLIAVDMQTASRKYLMKLIAEVRRSLLEDRKNPDPLGNKWDLLFIADKTDRSIEDDNIWHYVLDVRLEVIQHSIIAEVNVGS